jgi:hypothetical protein
MPVGKKEWNFILKLEKQAWLLQINASYALRRRTEAFFFYSSLTIKQ